MIRFSRTLRNWKQEIINSFILVDYEYKVDKETGRVAVQPKKMNNAIIENKNSIIKTIKKNANGYTNWNSSVTESCMFWIPKPLSVQNQCLYQNPVSDCENDQLLCRGATANNIAIAIPKGMKNSHDDGFFSFYIPFGRQHSKKTPLYYLKSRLLTSRVTHPMEV